MPTFLADRRFGRWMTPVRIAVLSALSAGYVFLVADIGHPGYGGWLLLLAALVVSWGSPRWPLVCALCQAGLLALGETLGADTVVPLKVLASFALFELAARKTGKPLAVAGIVLGAVYLAAGIAHSDKDVAGVVFQTAVVVGGPMVLGAYLGGVRARAGLAEERAAQQERLRHSEARMARVAERTAIARELHDLVAHHVASIVLRAGVARHLLPSDGDPRIREVLDDVHDTGSSAMTDLRRLVTVLRDPSTSETAGGDLVDPGELPIAIAAAVDRARQSGLAVDATVDPALSGLDAVTGLAVLRFVQEGLANVLKHAGPASAGDALGGRAGRHRPAQPRRRRRRCSRRPLARQGRGRAARSDRYAGTHRVARRNVARGPRGHRMAARGRAPRYRDAGRPGSRLAHRVRVKPTGVLALGTRCLTPRSPVGRMEFPLAPPGSG
ncbi:histidine kinase [Saccharomonospora sp. NPDC006951]